MIGLVDVDTIDHGHDVLSDHPKQRVKYKNTKRESTRYSQPQLVGKLFWLLEHGSEVVLDLILLDVMVLANDDLAHRMVRQTAVSPPAGKTREDSGMGSTSLVYVTHHRAQ